MAALLFFCADTENRFRALDKWGKVCYNFFNNPRNQSGGEKGLLR